MKRIRSLFLVFFLAISLTLTGCSESSNTTSPPNTTAKTENPVSKENQSDKKNTDKTPIVPEPAQAPNTTVIDVKSIPSYSGNAYVAINNNVPYFNTTEKSKKTTFETYSELDSLGRCGVAYANVSIDLMPTTERGSIGSVKPSGWQTIKYDNVSGKYLYNRCHLIGYQLSGENANEKNLITGTRYLNIDGMLPFENMVADYIKETKNHVLYRITPIFNGNNLLANGVLMEGYSVEDSGKGITFCVYTYNVQPGITITYSNGDSQGPEVVATAPVSTPAPAPPAPSPTPAPTTPANPVAETYILNTSTKKFHKPSCGSVNTIKESNKGSFTGSRDELINQGYSPCGNCNP